MFRQLLFRRACNAVPDVHVRALEKIKIPVPPDHVLVLIDPALPGGVFVDDAVEGFLRAAHHLADELLPDGACLPDEPIGKAGQEEYVEVLQNRAFDVGVVHGGHTVSNGSRDGQPLIGQHVHEDECSVGHAVENVNLPAVALHDIIAQPPCLIRHGPELRLRLIGIEAVVGHQHHMVGFRHLLCHRQCAAIAHPAAMKHDHQLRMLLPELKVFHALSSCSRFFLYPQSQ